MNEKFPILTVKIINQTIARIHVVGETNPEICSIKYGTSPKHIYEL